MHSNLFKFIAASSLVLLSSSAMAQKVIKMVVPFGPGAVQDTVARTFNNELGQILDATVIIENKAGAGSTIGTNFVAKSVPDGSTLILAAASHTLMVSRLITMHSPETKRSILKSTDIFHLTRFLMEAIQKRV